MSYQGEYLVLTYNPPCECDFVYLVPVAIKLVNLGNVYSWTKDSFPRRRSHYTGI